MSSPLIAAEKALLGSLLIDRYVGQTLDIIPEDFSLSPHQDIYRAMQTAMTVGQPTDVLVVSDLLGDQIDRVGGLGYLTELATSVPTSLNAAAYADVVKRAALRTRAVAVATGLTHDLMAGSAAVEQTLSSARLALDGLLTQASHDWQTLPEVNTRVRAHLDHLAAHTHVLTGLSTGYLDLDTLTGGLQGGDLILLAGRTGMGKSAFAINLVHALALGAEKHVAIFSVEMDAQAYATRLLAIQTGLDAQRLRTGPLSRAEVERAEQGLTRLDRARIKLDDQMGLTADQIASRASALHAADPVDLIVVDYLQLVAGEQRGGRVQEIASISRRLKRLARDLDVPVLALCQVNRGPESHDRESHEPMLSDLRDSGALEQDADIVLFVYRPAVYDPSISERLAKIIVAKQRNGPTGAVQLLWDARTTAFLTPVVREDGAVITDPEDEEGYLI